jgi:hypothetical protein
VALATLLLLGISTTRKRLPRDHTSGCTFICDSSTAQSTANTAGWFAFPRRRVDRPKFPHPCEAIWSIQQEVIPSHNSTVALSAIAAMDSILDPIRDWFEGTTVSMDNPASGFC